MRLLLGVDPEGRYRSALTLLARLNFGNVAAMLVHVDEGSDFPVALPTTPVFTGRAGQSLVHDGNTHMLSLAEDEAREAGFDVETRYEVGNPGERLMEQASDTDTDLVALGSQWPGASLRQVLGSVERAFVNDFGRSFLVSHGSVAPEGRVRVVFATDHSEYADASLDRLLAWNPQGIEEIVVATAVEQHSPSLLQRLFHHEPERDPVELVDELWQRSNAIAERVVAAGIEARVRVLPGPVDVVLRKIVEETGADMLAMGARGHTFTERVVAGSVAQEQVLHAAYPVLVLRG